MSIKRELPESVQRLIASTVPEAEVRVIAESDLGPDGNYGEQWLALAGDRVLVTEPDGQVGKLILDVPLSDISEVDIEALIGGSALRAQVKGRWVRLISFTNALSNHFGRVRAQLDAAVKGKPIPDPEEKLLRCSTCNLVLGEDTQVCPRCSRRGATLRRLMSYAKPYHGKLTLTGVLMLVGTAFGLLSPYLTKLLLDRVLAPKTVEAKAYAAQHGISLLGWLVLALAVSSVLSTVLQIWRNRLTAWLGGKVSFDIRAALYDRLQWLSMRYYDRHPTGAIISRLTQDSGGVQDFLAFGLPFLVTNILTIIGVSAMVFAINWKLALLALVPAVMVSMVTRPLWEKMRAAFHAFWFRWGRFHSLVNDALNRVKMIKAFSQQPTEIDAVQRAQRGPDAGVGLRRADLGNGVPGAVAAHRQRLAAGVVLRRHDECAGHADDRRPDGLPGLSRHALRAAELPDPGGAVGLSVADRGRAHLRGAGCGVRQRAGEGRDRARAHARRGRVPQRHLRLREATTRCSRTSLSPASPARCWAWSARAAPARRRSST